MDPEIDYTRLSGEYFQVAAGLAIFSKYGGSRTVYAEHDILYAGPNPNEVIISVEDMEFLDSIQWFPIEEDGCWGKFT